MPTNYLLMIVMGFACTEYTVSVYSVQCTVYIVLCILYSVYCILVHPLHYVHIPLLAN